MKATGIVRKIDDLGRIVIPKEIRRTMRIREGDPLEIFTDKEGLVIFKKYSPMGEMGEIAIKMAGSLYKITNKPCVICDRDSVTVSFGAKDLEERPISDKLTSIMEARKTFLADMDNPVFEIYEGAGYFVCAASTIICEGDVLGAVAVLSDKDSCDNCKNDEKLINLCSSFLAKQMEN